MRKFTLTLAMLGTTAMTAPAFADGHLQIVDEPLELSIHMHWPRAGISLAIDVADLGARARGAPPELTCGQPPARGLAPALWRMPMWRMPLLVLLIFKLLAKHKKIKKIKKKNIYTYTVTVSRVFGKDGTAHAHLFI